MVGDGVRGLDGGVGARVSAGVGSAVVSIMDDAVSWRWWVGAGAGATGSLSDTAVTGVAVVDAEGVEIFKGGGGS